MKRYIHIIIYLLLAAASILVFTKLVLDSLAFDKNYHVDLWVYRISNPFILVVVFMLPLFYALIYLLFSVYEAKETMIVKQDELASLNKTTQEIIEEEIHNRYQDKIELIQSKIFSKVEKETLAAQKVEKALWAFCNELSLSQGLVYKRASGAEESTFELLTTFAYIGDLSRINRFEVGVGINGQVAYSGEPIFIDDVPDNYLKVISGLGESNPTLLLIVPIKNPKNEVIGLIEVSGFGALNTKEVQTIYQISQTVFSNILM